MSNVNQDCQKLHQHLALYAGRDLEEPLCEELEQHLAGCGVCRAELAKTLAARERIGVFGAQNSLGLDALDLWPAVRTAWLREREATRIEVALLNHMARPRALRRRWIPVALAAAAALVITLGWALDLGSKTAPSNLVLTPVAGSAPQFVLNTPGNAVIEPFAAGSLRRAAPGEERLRDSSAPLQLPRRAWPTSGGGETPNSLAGDDGLR